MEDMVSLSLIAKDWAKLAEGDQGFALSLLGQHKSKGKLSDKQWPWVTKLAKSLTEGDKALIPGSAKPIKVGDMAVILDLFKFAGAKMQFPAITLALTIKGQDEKVPMKMWVSGAKSKHPGHLAVVTGKKDWAGWVSPQGIWMPGNKIPGNLESNVVMMLAKFVHAPADVAAEYGHLTGHCCFCRAELSDPKSTKVGYGPVCAKNWKMPWG